jgi:hypothetical protein
MKLSRDAGRSIGALIGLAVGILTMQAFGHGGIVHAFLYGAGGTVLGGMIGERLAERSPPE